MPADRQPASRYQPYLESLATPGPEEQQLAQELSEVLLSISEQTWQDGHHALRSVHAKSHGLLQARLEVLPDLPEVLRQGLFAQPGTFDAVLRLSTTPGDLLPDRVSTPRGVALRVLEVPGERLEDSEGQRGQDFIMVNGPQFNSPDARSFLRSLKLLARTTDRAERSKALGSAFLRGTERALEAIGSQSAKLKAMGGEPAHHILGETFFTQLPLRFGDYIAKLQLVPISSALLALEDAPIDLKQDNALREAVSAYFQQHDAVWELRAQLCTNLEDMPVDDPTVAWDEGTSPFQPVARLTAARQASWNPDKVRAIDDGAGFSPWHGLQAHRPLGELMRVRKLAYAASQAFRASKNGIALEERRCPV